MKPIQLYCVAIHGRKMPASLAAKYPAGNGWFYRWFRLNYGGRINGLSQWTVSLIAEIHEVAPDRIELALHVKQGTRVKVVFRLKPNQTAANPT